LVNVERRRLDAILSAALVCTASAIIIVPWHVFLGASSIASAPLHEIVWQILFQGVMFSAVAFVALNCAIRLIGSQNVGVLTAMVPVIGGFCSSMIAGDSISNVEWAGIGTISISVVAASLAPRIRARAARISLSPRMTHSMPGQTRAG
jgi:drug/metabolite transporter (DMT)-like permease